MKFYYTFLKYHILRDLNKREIIFRLYKNYLMRYLSIYIF